MTRPSRVLIITPHYPPKRLGGTELRARKLARELAQRGINAQVLCVESLTTGTSETCAMSSDPYEGIRVHRLDLTTPAGIHHSSHSFDNPLIEGAIEKIIRDEKIDLVHLISGYLVTACAIRAAHRYDLPAVVTLTDYWFVCPRIKLIRSTGDICGGPYSTLDCSRCLLGESRRYRWPEQALVPLADLAWRIVDRVGPLKNRLAVYTLLRRRAEVLMGLLNEADAITIPTNSLRPRLVRAGTNDRFVLSRHSLDFNLVDYERATPKSASSMIRFGYIGQIQSSKGIDLVIRAFRELVGKYGNISLVIWGDPEQDTRFSARLKALSRDLANVSICGRYEPSNLPVVMADIDVLVVPSRWPEIGPFVIPEAFATRTPVIAADIGNIPELVEHGVNGLLFAPNDSADLQLQMERVLTDLTLLKHLTDGIPAVRTMDDEMTEILRVYADLFETRKVRSDADEA
jgi:glycosyltransferase involved in cell wall biosynthesis